MVWEQDALHGQLCCCQQQQRASTPAALAIAVAAALGRPSAVHSEYLLLSEGLSPKQSSKAAALVSLTLLGG